MQILRKKLFSLSAEKSHPPHIIHILHPKGHGEVPAPAILIEVHAEHLPAGEGQFVQGENQFPYTVGWDGAQPVDLLGEDGFLVLEPALRAFLALHGKAGRSQRIAHGGRVMKGYQQEQDVVLVEDILAQDLYPVSLRAQMVKFLFHSCTNCQLLLLTFPPIPQIAR